MPPEAVRDLEAPEPASLVRPTPFVFSGCSQLLEILGPRARDERELMEMLERAPAGAVYFHTHRRFGVDPRVLGPYANDFADWVAFPIGDVKLAERLSVVDPFKFQTLDGLREEIVSILHQHISTLPLVPRVVFGEPFFFAQAHVVEVPTAFAAASLDEFQHALKQVDPSAVYFHGIHARVSRGVPDGDVGRWIRQELGLTALADEIGRINPYLGGLEELRDRMLRTIEAFQSAQGPGDGR
jgi:hypothetical protein